MENNTCFCCKKQFPLYDLRPYGPDKAMVCSGCWDDPRYTDIIQANVYQALEAVKAEVRKRLEAGEKVAIRVDEDRGYIVVPISDMKPDDIVRVMDLGPDPGKVS